MHATVGHTAPKKQGPLHRRRKYHLADQGAAVQFMTFFIIFSFRPSSVDSQQSSES